MIHLSDEFNHDDIETYFTDDFEEEIKTFDGIDLTDDHDDILTSNIHGFFDIYENHHLYFEPSKRHTNQDEYDDYMKIGNENRNILDGTKRHQHKLTNERNNQKRQDNKLKEYETLLEKKGLPYTFKHFKQTKNNHGIKFLRNKGLIK